MKPLPGRRARVNAETPPAAVTRNNAHADQRRRILRATGELVAERGFADVTVEMIVKRARVSFKTLYKHYRGKEEAFVDLVDTASSRTEQRLREAIAANPGPWPEKVEVALRMLFEAIDHEPAVARAVIVESPAAGPALIVRYEKGTEALVSLLREGRDLSPRGSQLPATIEVTLAGAVFWAAYQRLIAGETDELLRTDLPILVELILGTYLSPAEVTGIPGGRGARREPVLA